MYQDSEQPQHNPKEHAYKALEWMYEEPIFLDTETTGLDNSAEIVEIAIVDVYGEVLLNTLIKPQNPIPQEVTDIHSITNDMVKDASEWDEIYPEFHQIIKNRTLIIYNSSYDVRIIDQTSAASIASENLDESALNWDKDQKIHCAMKLFAAFNGDWDTRRQSWKWQKLTVAADYMRVEVEGKAHRALADCYMTLGVVQAMANRSSFWKEREVNSNES